MLAASDHASRPSEAVRATTPGHTRKRAPAATPARTSAAPAPSSRRWAPVRPGPGGGAADQVIVNIWAAPDIAARTEPTTKACSGPHHEPPPIRVTAAQASARIPNAPARRRESRAMV